jgi:hypothetical protein
MGMENDSGMIMTGKLKNSEKSAQNWFRVVSSGVLCYYQYSGSTTRVSVTYGSRIYFNRNDKIHN